MFSRRKCTNVGDSVVLVVKESYWTKLFVIDVNYQLYLCQSFESSNSTLDSKCSNNLKYEIIYHGFKTLSLCRVRSMTVALARFKCLASIINAMFPKPGSFARTSSLFMKTFQRVINTMVEHPNWIDVHVAAFVSCFTFHIYSNVSFLERILGFLQANQASDKRYQLSKRT